MAETTPSKMDRLWLSKCCDENMPCPPLDRYIYILRHHVVKKRLTDGELGDNNHKPDFSTLKIRDDNEIRALELVRKYTDVPVPKLIYQGDGFNVFQRIPGVTVNERETWQKVSPRQREAIKFQVQDFIRQLANNIPNATGGIRSLTTLGEVIHDQLPHRGPFDSTEAFLEAYQNENAPEIHSIDPLSKPVFSHMDWNLSNIVLHPNFDGVAGVIDWERAAFFPESGKSIHRMCHHWEGWETLFDGLEIERGDNRFR